MEQREEAQRHVGLGVGAAPRGVRLGRRQQVLVGRQDALRVAGRPGGVRLDGDVLEGPLGPVELGGGGAGVLVVVLHTLGAAGDERKRDVVGEVGADARERRRGDQRLGAGILEDVLQPPAVRPVVQWHRDRAGLDDAEQRLGELQGVLQIQRDPVAGVDARVDQGVCHPVRAGLEVGVALLVAPVLDGEFLAVPLGIHRGTSPRRLSGAPSWYFIGGDACAVLTKVLARRWGANHTR